MIIGESLEQQLEIPQRDILQLALRGKLSSSRNGSKALMSARLYMLVYVGLGPISELSLM